MIILQCDVIPLLLLKNFKLNYIRIEIVCILKAKRAQMLFCKTRSLVILDFKRITDF